MEVSSAEKAKGLVKYLAKCLIEFAKQIESLQYREKSSMDEDVEINKRDDEGNDIQIVEHNINISYECVTDTGIIFPQLLRLRNQIVKLLTVCTEQNIYVAYDPSEIHNVLYSNLNNNARIIIVNYLTIHMIDFVEYIIIATNFFILKKLEQTHSQIKKKFATIYKILKSLPSLPEITKNKSNFEKSLNNSQFCSELLNRLLVLNKYIKKFNRAYHKSILNTDSASADDKISVVSYEERVTKEPIAGNKSFKLPEFFENTRVENTAQQTMTTIEILENAPPSLNNKKQLKLVTDNLENRESKSAKAKEFSTCNSQSEDKQNTKKKNKFSVSDDSSTEKNKSDKETKQTRTENVVETNISKIAEDTKKRKRINSDSKSVEQKRKKSNKIITYKSNEFINTSSETDYEISSELQTENKENIKTLEKVKKDDKPDKISKRRMTQGNALNKSNISLDSDKTQEIIEKTKYDHQENDQRKKEKRRKKELHSDESDAKQQKEDKTVEEAKPAKISNRRMSEGITLSKCNISSNSDQPDEDKEEKGAKRKTTPKNLEDEETAKPKKEKKTGKDIKIRNEHIKKVKKNLYKNPAGETIDSVDILSAIESGDIKVDYEETEFEDLINTIKIHDLTDNERFLYIQDFVHEAGDRMALTEELKEKLNTLFIEVDWEVPPAHQIATRLSAIPTQEEKEELKKIGITYGGKFTTAESDIIKKNWKEFSEIYGFPDPKPFLSFYYKGNKSALQFYQRKKFVQFLGKGLPHKALYSIYKRFKTICTKQSVKMGRFSPEEDLLIMTYVKKLKRQDESNKFSKLALVLNRERCQIERRYKAIKDRAIQKVTWTLERLESLIQHLLDEINSEDINDLRDFSFDHPAFNYAARQMDMNPRKLKFHFVFHLSSRLFSQEPLFTNKIKVQIIESLIEKKARDWKEIDWKSLAEQYEGVKPQYLWYLLKTTLRSVPENHHENLKFCLRYLKKYYIPNLKRSKLYEHKHLTRLKWAEGKLQEYI